MSIKFECPACGKRLNAPDTAVGKTAKCPACSMSVKVPAPEKIYEAEEVSDAPEEEDWEAPPDDDLPVSGRSYSSRNDDVEDEVDRKACPMCGEMINVAAKKCRYCGESLVGGKKKKKKKQSSEDTQMQVSDWVLCILCGTIGCIMGIVYLIQGKPKGGIMIGVSIGFAILWNILATVLSAVLNAM